jgi:HEAT repeat protein
MAETLSVLIGALTHPDHNVRGRAAVGLGTAADDRATGALIRALGAERDPFVRENITWALVRMGDAAVAPLIDLAKDENPRARHGAVHALSKIRDPRGADTFIAALRDVDLSVVTKAAFALGESAHVAAIPALVELLGREERELQATLMLAFENFGRAALQPLIQALAHDEWRVREQAASALELLGEADAAPALVRVLDDAHWQVRFASVQALGALGGTEAKQALERMLNDSDQRVRAVASRLASSGLQ